MRLPADSLEVTNLYFEDGALPNCQMGWWLLDPGCRWKSAEGWKLSCVGRELRSDIGCRKVKDNSRALGKEAAGGQLQRVYCVMGYNRLS